MASSNNKDMRPALRAPYKTVDGVEIPTDIYLPMKVSQKDAPVLIMCVCVSIIFPPLKKLPKKDP
jgi:predicted acyl esterase